MSFNPLLLLPPETAHYTALKAAQYGVVPKAAPDKPEHAIKLFGKTFRNPIGLAAGADKNAIGLKGWEKIGFGFVEAGTVTLKPREGNPKPRLWRFHDEKALVNWMGLSGEGLKAFLKKIQHFKEKNQNTLLVGISIASPDKIPEELEELAQKCSKQADYIAFNVSCGNLGKDVANTEELQKDLEIVVKNAENTPIFVKLGPSRDEKSVKEMVGTALKGGAQGIITTNTIPAPNKNLLKQEWSDEKWPKNKENMVGSYSGPQLLDISTQMVCWAREVGGKDMPLIGVGGIQSGEDSKAMLEAGANLIQIYTGFVYKGPNLLKEIKAAL